MKKILIRYLKRHAWQVIATILIVIISVLLSILPPRILHHIIDNYLKDGLPKTLMILGVLYFSSFLLINVMELIKEIILNVVAQGIIKESKMVMLNKLHKMSYKDLTSFTYGEIEAYFNNDVESINLLITSGFVSFVIDIFKIVGIIISIFLFSISFGLLALSILPFLFLVALLMRKLSFKKQYKMRELEGKGNNKALEMISNSLVLKAMNLTTFVQKDFEHTINEHYSATREAHFVDSIFAPLMQVFKYLAITLVIIISSKNVSLGMEIGVVAACIDYITDLFKPIENLGTEINTMQKSFARIRHLEHFLKLDEEEKKECDIDINSLALENVSFAYDSVHMIVDNFSLKINRNEKITFIGKSGAGKSTIFKLITGIVSPNKGAVRISDVDSYDFSSTMRKKTFSILFQEPFFLHKTMREEIRLFDENIDDDQILIALQKVGMDKRVELDEKYDPIKYSTGEKMLLNLARIIVNPCEIILLDEMNSQIDSITLEKIIEEVEKISQNRMVVSIEHYGRKLQGCKIVELK